MLLIEHICISDIYIFWYGALRSWNDSHELFKESREANNGNLAPFIWITYEKSHLKCDQRKIAIKRKNLESFERAILNGSSRGTRICFAPFLKLDYSFLLNFKSS